MENFVNSFVELVRYVTPFVLVWRIGIYIVNVLINAICGGGRSGKIDL
ncbi:hypothetical protein GCM10007417_29030 [Glycocaulis alkaliphilus]|nr:hypothetical protein GCM10007417_29030 [Glycocaulis alkaliphilus]